MSYCTSRSSRANSVRQPLPFCSPFLKNKDMNEMFLDKKGMTRKLQKLMLQVRDLDSKMFLSQMVSYLGNQQSGNNNVEVIQNKFNQKFQQQRIQDLLFSNQIQNQQKQTQEVTFNVSGQKKDQQKVHSLSLCPLLVSLDLHPVQVQEKDEEKDMFETATSQGFFPKKRPSIHVSNPIIEESFSEASTIQCECGLFQALLLMVSRFIKEEIVKNRQQSEDDCLEIDEQFVQEITREVISKFYEKENQHKKEVQILKLELEKTKELLKAKEQLLAKDGLVAKESLAIREALKQKQGQLLQAVQQISKMSGQLKNLDKQFNECSKKLAQQKMNFEQLQISFSQLQDQYLTVNKQKQQLQAKLLVAQKQIEKHSDDKELYEEMKQHQIDSLSFELELKNTQIRNMKTIIESLQKRSSLYSKQSGEMQREKDDNEESGEKEVLPVQQNQQEQN